MSNTTTEAAEATEKTAGVVSGDNDQPGNDADTTEGQAGRVPNATKAEDAPIQGPDKSDDANSDDADADDPAEDQDQAPKASREAAKYRRQLRDTEAERDTLKAQVATMRAAIAEEALTGVLAKPSSLWLTGVDASDFYDDAGNLDTEALEAEARKAAQEHGLQPHKRFQGSADGGSRNVGAEVPRRFADMFAPKR